MKKEKDKPLPDMVIGVEVRVQRGTIPLELILDQLNEVAADTTVASTQNEYIIHVQKAAKHSEDVEKIAYRLFREVTNTIRAIAVFLAISKTIYGARA